MTELEKRRVRLSAGDMAFVELGDVEDPPIVFLHGFPTSSFLWREFLPMCAPWMRVIAPDLLGCGESRANEGAELHIRAQAGYVRELLEGLGVARFAVVGHGHGGGVAQLLALEGLVDVMVLLDTVAFDAWPSQDTRSLQRIAPEDQHEERVRDELDAFLRTAIAHGERLTTEIRDEYLRPFAGDGGVRAFFRGIHASDGLGLAGWEHELAGLECPTLVLWGEDDPFFPIAVAERLNDAIPTSSLAILPGCSHLLPEDATETIAPLIFEYLRSKYLGRPHTHDASGPVPVALERRPPTR